MAVMSQPTVLHPSRGDFFDGSERDHTDVRCDLSVSMAFSIAHTPLSAPQNRLEKGGTRCGAHHSGTKVKPMAQWKWRENKMELIYTIFPCYFWIKCCLKIYIKYHLLYDKTPNLNLRREKTTDWLLVNVVHAEHVRQETWDIICETGDVRQKIWERIHDPGDVRQEPWDRSHETGAMRQEPWDRSRETGDMRQETRNIRQETLDVRQKTWYNKQETRSRRQETGYKRQDMWDRRREAGDKRQAIRNVIQEMWDRREETSDWRL